MASYVPFFALCLFAGIRPCLRTGEILRLKPEDVNIETGIIFVSADVSKVREPRKVTIQPNLAAWLKAYPPTDDFPIVPKNLQHVRARIAKACRLSHHPATETCPPLRQFFKFSTGHSSCPSGDAKTRARRGGVNNPFSPE